MSDHPVPPPLQPHKLEALGHFAGGIAHDFNNILSVIEGYATRGIRQAPAGEGAVEALHKILQSTERGAGLTRQLLAFARQNLDLMASVDVTTELARIEILLAPLLGENINLSLPRHTGQLYAQISPDRLTQIILNLAINARDAMEGRGHLRIGLDAVDLARLTPAIQARLRGRTCIHISVTDDGCGMTSDEIAHIFEPFFTTKRGRSGTGTGLGLSVVYGIVEQAGGAIAVKSQPGKGACFDVYLPQGEPPQDMMLTATPKKGASLAGRTIILAEDEPELRDVLSLMLQDMEMKVLPAANGNEALRLQDVYEGEIDFLLTDIVMPGINGVQLSDLFIRERPDTNVILMSGYPFLQPGQSLPVPQDADFLPKPFRSDKIRQILERALSRKADRLAALDGVDATPPE